MEAEERNKLLERSSILRQELKVWEREFSSKNGGGKPGRDDIKSNPSIAQKYKDYNRTRDILSGKVVAQESSSPRTHQSQKRKHDFHQHTTPSKKLRKVSTPMKTGTHPSNIDPYESPSAIRNLFTPLKDRILGPTPQKDGQVLGLFDLLSADDETPQRPAPIAPTAQLQATPRKANQNLDVPNTGRHCRTPASSGKRFLLDSFATPLHGRHPNEQLSKTPSSISKLHFSTPSFLRRDSQRVSMPSISEADPSLAISPEMVRLPRKPLVRGLSSILASLRKMEEDQLDDDLEALHDMESGNTAPVAVSKKAVTSKAAAIVDEQILVEDSQTRLPLGGFDDEGKYDSEPEVLTRDGASANLKVWKKKGQKRTTRRVNIKPSRAKPAKQEDSPVVREEDSSEDELPTLEEKDENETVPETQQEATSLFSASARNFDSDSGSEYTASEGGTRYRRANQTKKRKVMGKDGKVRRMIRKVAGDAHANFKRLKLRNSGAKGGPGHNSKFRRRR